MFRRNKEITILHSRQSNNLSPMKITWMVTRSGGSKMAKTKQKKTNRLSENTNSQLMVSDELIIDSTYEYDKNLPLLSLVIPVYNVERFLNRCLTSVVNQTYKNIEIICVNDASAGNEDAIIRSYCETDKRIKYVRHTKNRGLFQARITGMKYAKGDYFAFLDSDDHISIDYFRILMDKIVEEKADMVISDFIDEYEDGRKEYYNYDNIRFRDIILEGDEVYDTFMKQHGLWFGWHTVWNKVYKKSVWDESEKCLSEFSEKHGHLIMTEDVAFSSVFWRHANKVVNAHNAFLYYYHHSGQSVANTTLEKFKKNATDVASVFEFFREMLIGEGVYEKYEKDYIEFLNVYIGFWTGNVNALSEEEKVAGREHVLKLFGTTKVNPYKDHYHYSMRTQIGETFDWYDQIKTTICSDEIKVVSFDIFDTLLLRPFFKPSDIFCLMDDYFNEIVNGLSYVDFQKIRINAEAYLRTKLSMGREEITLDEIYSEIQNMFLLTDEQTKKLKDYETELELKYIQPRKCGMELYKLAKHLNKKVIYVSDMYLPHDVIIGLLKKCGYEEEQLYLSSDYMVSKSTGNLYSLVLKMEDCLSENIVHIGDNWDSDIVKAQEKKIRAHHLVAPIAQFKEENGGIYSGTLFTKLFKPSGKQYMGETAVNYMGIRCMLALVANKIFDNPYIAPFNQYTDFNSNPYYIGYYALGMHLYAVTRWIADISEKEGRNTIHFVSRDGYLPMKAYEILKRYRNLNSNSNYLYVSRKATAQLQCSNIADMYSYLNSFSSYNISVKTPIDTFEGFAKDDVKGNYAEMVKHGLVYTGKVSGFGEVNKLCQLIFDEFIDEEKAEYFNIKAKEFFSEIIKQDDILFDLGYRANKEYLLSSLIGRPVDCLYIYSNESKAMQRANKKFSMRTFFDYTPSVFAAAREYMFSELAPSCVGYDYEKDFSPVFDEKFEEHYFNEFVVGAMQSAALDFVDDFERTFGDTIIADLYRNFDASLPFEYFLHYSPRTDRNVFDCVTFEDDTFAGGMSKMGDDWEKAISWHKLNSAGGERIIVETQYKIIEKQVDSVGNTTAIATADIPEELETLYTDGMFVKAYTKLNSKYPLGSKKRERMKKFAKLFIK